jgi:hypothetical protein
VNTVSCLSFCRKFFVRRLVNASLALYLLANIGLLRKANFIVSLVAVYVVVSVCLCGCVAMWLCVCVFVCLSGCVVVWLW